MQKKHILALVLGSLSPFVGEDSNLLLFMFALTLFSLQGARQPFNNVRALNSSEKKRWTNHWGLWRQSSKWWRGKHGLTEESELRLVGKLVVPLARCSSEYPSIEPSVFFFFFCATSFVGRPPRMAVNVLYHPSRQLLNEVLPLRLPSHAPQVF